MTHPAKVRKPLTDAQVALALGYRVESRVYNRPPQIFTGRRGGHGKKMPPFTTSLDAIVGEIERRGYRWSVGFGGEGATAFLADVTANKSVIDCEAETAPLALCVALLAYLGGKRG